MRSTTASIILAFVAWGGFVVCGAAQTASHGPALSAQVLLTNGKTRNISKVSGSVTCWANDGGSLQIPFGMITKVEIVKGGSDVTISLLDGESVSGRPEPFVVRGEGDWGESEFSSKQIASVVFSNHPPRDSAKRKGMSAVVVMSGGNRKTISSLNTSQTVDCDSGGFSLSLELEQVQQLDITEGGAQIKALLTDGSVVSGRTKPFTLSGAANVGSIRIKSTEMKSAVFSEHTQKHTRVDGGIDLSLQSREGVTITGRIASVVLGHFHVTMAPTNIASLVFPVESNRLRIQTHDAKEWTFHFGPTESKNRSVNNVSGTFAGGTFSIPYGEVTAISLAGSTRAPTTQVSKLPDSSSTTVSTVEDIMGFRVETIGVPTIFGEHRMFDIYFPDAGRLEQKDVAIIEDDDVRYLFDGTTILQHGLQVANGTLSLYIGGETVFSGQQIATDLRGKCAVGDFSIAAQYIRSVSMTPKLDDKETLYMAADADAIVKTTKGRVLFVREPILNADNTIRSGYYLVGGGRLYRLSYRRLPVKTPDGDTILVSFDRIHLLTVDKRYPNIRLESKNGQELVGSIDLDGLKAHSDTTFLSDEGIVGKISPSIYVFIPFAYIDSIKFRSE